MELNWFELYWEMISKTGIVGIFIFFITIIGLFYMSIPFLCIFSNNFNKKSIITSTHLTMFLIVYILTGNTIIQEIYITGKYQDALTLLYFFNGFLPFITFPLYNHQYIKFKKSKRNKKR
jgi:hypothetical protein